MFSIFPPGIYEKATEKMYHRIRGIAVSARCYTEDGSMHSTFHFDGRIHPMFIVLLRFSDNKAQAGQFMEGHNGWIKRGFDDGVFLLVGSLQPKLGGGIVAHNTTLSDLQNRVSVDPFVAEDVVDAEILEITPARADDRLNFLLS
jgi:uncharacterized protein YciI